jgi:hypothetical protein
MLAQNSGSDARMRRKVDELRRRAAGEAADGADEDLAIHPLPEGPSPRKGPVGVSTAIHLLVIFLIILESLRSEKPPEPPQGLNLVFEQPDTTPDEPIPPLIKPRQQPRREARPAPAEPKPAARNPVTPPAVPKEIPPPTPVPPPTRMGELVPIPHLPVPGKVPPEEGKSGKPGPPAQEKPLEKPGTPDGTNDRDLGAGGPGRTGTPAAGPGVGPGSGVVQGESRGSIPVPPLGGGPSTHAGTGGGGERRGLNYSLPIQNGVFGDFSFDDKDYDWNDYYSQMYWAIMYKWLNCIYKGLPRFEQWAAIHHTTTLGGTLLVHFVIERNGKVSTTTIIEPSIMLPLDQSAVCGLTEAILPPLPADFTKDSEGITGRFIMENGEMNDWKEFMKYQKYRGIF